MISWMGRLVWFPSALKDWVLVGDEIGVEIGFVDGGRV